MFTDGLEVVCAEALTRAQNGIEEQLREEISKFEREKEERAKEQEEREAAHKLEVKKIRRKVLPRCG